MSWPTNDVRCIWPAPTTAELPRLLGGTLRLSSTIGVGTALVAEMPLADAALAVGTDTG